MKIIHTAMVIVNPAPDCVEHRGTVHSPYEVWFRAEGGDEWHYAETVTSESFGLYRATQLLGELANSVPYSDRVLPDWRDLELIGMFNLLNNNIKDPLIQEVLALMRSARN